QARKGSPSGARSAFHLPWRLPVGAHTAWCYPSGTGSSMRLVILILPVRSSRRVMLPAIVRPKVHRQRDVCPFGGIGYEGVERGPEGADRRAWREQLRENRHRGGRLPGLRGPGRRRKSSPFT